MKKSAKYLLLLSLLPLVACSKAPNCSISSQLKLQVEKSRNLKFTDSLKCRLLSQEQMRDELIAVIMEQNSEQALRAEEQVYKFTGIIPEDFGYLEGLIKGYQSQIVGFYHFHDAYFGLAEGVDEKEKRYTLIHELTHALQDQNYKVTELMPEGSSSDLLLARRALLEADAKRVVDIYRRKFDCNRHNERTALIEARHRIFVSSLNHIPRPLRMLIDFPYTHGLPFICEAKRIGELDSFDQLFERPPTTTREIIHPELYVADKPVIEISSSGIDDDFEFSSSIGEFTIFAMLAGFLDMQTSYKAASGLENDKFWLYDSEMRWRSLWSSARDAEEFVDSLVSQFVARYPESVQQNQGKAMLVKAEGVALRVSRNESSVEVRYKNSS